MEKRVEESQVATKRPVNGQEIDGDVSNNLVQSQEFEANVMEYANMASERLLQRAEFEKNIEVSVRERVVSY